MVLSTSHLPDKALHPTGTCILHSGGSSGFESTCTVVKEYRIPPEAHAYNTTNFNCPRAGWLAGKNSFFFSWMLRWHHHRDDSSLAPAQLQFHCTILLNLFVLLYNTTVQYSFTPSKRGETSMSTFTLSMEINMLKFRCELDEKNAKAGRLSTCCNCDEQTRRNCN
jgi:hypothetical protein